MICMCHTARAAVISSACKILSTTGVGGKGQGWYVIIDRSNRCPMLFFYREYPQRVEAQGMRSESLFPVDVLFFHQYSRLKHSDRLSIDMTEKRFLNFRLYWYLLVS